MQRKKPEVDVVKDILEAAITAQPHSAFLSSLYHQYIERGGLSKKQLEGLLLKAQKVNGIPPARLATLQALVLKRPTRYRSAPPPPRPMFQQDEEQGRMIHEILGKYPQHKQVMLIKAKYERHEPLLPAEAHDLKKFHALLIKP